MLKAYTEDIVIVHTDKETRQRWAVVKASEKGRDTLRTREGELGTLHNIEYNVQCEKEAGIRQMFYGVRWSVCQAIERDEERGVRWDLGLTWDTIIGESDV